MRRLLLVPTAVALVGCASSTEFNRVMEKPAAVAKNAAEVAKAADQDLVRALALGVYRPDDAPDLPIVLCWPSKGPDVAGANLMTFSDALQTVNKVAAKPEGTSYATFIRKFGELEKAGNRDLKAERAEALKEIQASRERCEMLATQDARGQLVDVSGVGVAIVVPPIFGTILALDQLIKAIAAQSEKAARAAVVRTTIQNLVPQLREAAAELAKEPGPTFGPRVRYHPVGTNKEAEAMNGTVLGATITIRRWFVGAQARAQWAALEACRKGAPSMACLGRHSEAALADSFVANAYTYRALAQNDAQKLLEQLKKATDGAEAATKGSLADMIDALIGIGDALSGISDKYEAYRKTRE